MFLRALLLTELWDGEMRSVSVGGRAVLLIRLGDTVKAYEDRCAHAGVPLSAGRLQGRVLTCAAHEWQFDACTGCGINPRRARLCEFSVRVEGQDVLVDVSRVT